MSLIEAHNLVFTYNKKDLIIYNALNDVSFNIEKGDFFSIVGKTGSGKSTLIQTLNALILPLKGFNKVEDFIVTSDKSIKKDLIKRKIKKRKDFKNYSRLRKEVGIVFQFSENQLFAETVLKDVMFGPINFGMNEKDAKEIAIESLKKVGINEDLFDKSPFELSGGQKRRVALAGILASKPNVLILDEPTVGLDPIGKKDIINLIKEINKKGVTIIIVTHDMEVVNETQKVLVLEEGKVIKLTTPKELFNDKNINDYSLEIPNFYKFKKYLIKYGFKKDISNIDDLDDLIEVIKNYD